MQLLAVLLPLACASLRGSGHTHNVLLKKRDASVAADAHAELETMIHDAESSMEAAQACTGEKCEEDVRINSAKLHRYETAMEELGQIENSSIVIDLHKSKEKYATVKANMAQLEALRSSSILHLDMIEKEEKALLAHKKQIQQDLTGVEEVLRGAATEMSGSDADVQTKQEEAISWEAQVRAIVRAAQLSDQFADSVYAAGIEKHSEAAAAQSRADNLLRRAGELADRVDSAMTPPAIIEDHDSSITVGGWGSGNSSTESEVEPTEPASFVHADTEAAPAAAAAAADAEASADDEEAAAPEAASAPEAAPAPEAAAAPEAPAAPTVAAATKPEVAKAEVAPPAPEPVVAETTEQDVVPEQAPVSPEADANVVSNDLEDSADSEMASIDAELNAVGAQPDDA